MRKRLSRLLFFFLLATPLARAAASAEPSAMEQQVAEAVKSPDVTIVHFWAPWCPNCHAEMKPEGWAAFIKANPDVKFIFVNFWHRGMDPAPRLKAAELGAQANLTLLTHPLAPSSGDGRANSFLGFPVIWLPTTWVYSAGKQRYALNYGEIRFPMLQQLIDDTRDKWTH
jgi:thiol-disulfide isomerase/thioredoxin